MGTKWKSRILIAVWTFMFTFGISGILTFFAYGSDYIYRDYFHTPGFKSELDQIAGYLSMFELNDMSLDEAKKLITVTEEEIKEHRYRYGSLPEQIDNIKAQYEGRIQGAISANDKEAEKAFTDERDAKIKDITKNFESDDYVRPKVVKEKEKKLEQYYKDREQYRSDYLRYKDAYTYYFKDNETGKVYTNLHLEDDVSPMDYMNQENMLYVTNYKITSGDFVNYGYFYNEEILDIIPKTKGIINGKIGVPSSSNMVLQDYNNYQKKQIIFIGYTLASIIALILCFVLAKRAKGFPAEIEKWRSYYKKLPIDLRAVSLIITGIATIFSMFVAIDSIRFIFENIFEYGWIILVCLIIASFSIGLTIVQSKFLAPELKSWQNVKLEWEKALWYKAWKGMRVLYNSAKQNLREAFLNQSTGTQSFLVLGLVFGLGFTPILIFIHPIFLLFYLILLVLVGFPLVGVLIKRIGYFNRIVETTNELAAGNLGKDLPLSGESVLATLAGNINVLKHGVKASQNEQAKSERLKTELITNVSHDLRTPLTSIITYTELLKTEELSTEDRAAYLEIIDKKSKRLKVLIDDLFEVSKMASGNIELRKEKVDLIQLLQQAMAEHDDTINDSSLQFRVQKMEQPVYALVDGQKLWRVFDNLIGNILKYSLENSRVYISLETLNNQAIITFKNVTKYELSENVDELFERFKRGDTSRHTEGSGLGLAIAKSIVDLHEGRLEIEIEGDLFKVCITLKLEG